jgi:para-aminobenzoate synthetase
MRILVIDNFDSFTFNLYQLLAEASGQEPIVVHNDTRWADIAPDTIDAPESPESIDAIVISPGPGHPARLRDFGASIHAFSTELPVLGVCLGHQGLGMIEGGRIVHAPRPVHGGLSRIYHDGDPLFAGIAQGSEAVRYHSYVLAEPLPPSLRRIAWTEDGLVMGVAHRERPRWGIQFHPESICTEAGRRLLANFVDLVRAHRSPARHRSRLAAMSVVPRPAPATRSSAWRLVTERLDRAIDAEAWYLDEIADRRSGFWLDSSGGDAAGRYSFLGHAESTITYAVADRRVTVMSGDRIERHDGPLLDFLDRFLAARPVAPDPAVPFDFTGGLVGYFGYEVKAECGARLHHRSRMDDAAFLVVERFVAVDHDRDATYVVALAPPDHPGAEKRAREWCRATADRLASLRPAPPLRLPETAAMIELRPARGRDDYLRDIATCLDKIRDGETYEVCLTTQFSAQVDLDPVTFHRVLRRVSPAPYSALLRFDDVWIASSSPERFLRIDTRGAVESRPIKGTAPRGATPEEDEEQRSRLAFGDKERAENLMIVDLVRNDLGLVCEIGSVEVPGLMQIETYATVHQMVSTIRGRLRSGLSAIDCIRHAFPGGSMTGAPKLRTMEIIDALETGPRGVYSGAIGYLSTSGAADLSIAIRTAVLRPGHLSVGAGGAIVALSDPDVEYEEVLLKTRALRVAAELTRALEREETPRPHQMRTRLSGSR